MNVLELKAKRRTTIVTSPTMDQYVYRPNKVPSYQRVFQTGNAPVFLRGKSDRFVYRSAMILSVFGIGVSLFGIYQMATGTMTKKGR